MTGDETIGDESTMSDALHDALERGESPNAATQPALSEILRVARSLDAFVRHIEQGSGVCIVPAGDATGSFGRTPEAVPQPFPGEYRFRALLGEGNYGRVWLADDLRLGIPVALKTVRLRGDAGQQARALEALQHEARLMAQLKHPNIVQVYAWRQAGDEHYLVMQYVRGQSLKSRLETHGAFGWRLAAQYIADVAEALGHVHTRGVIHRDIKPANLLWDEATNEVLLSDFGVSAWVADADRGAAGTGFYMAPEVLHGGGGLPADVYSLAATLFQLVTGEVPFPAKSWPELAARVAAGLPNPDPRCAVIPAGVERVIRAGLTADPVRRPSLAAFAAELRGCLNQLLADSLVLPSAATPRVRLRVARRGPEGHYTLLAITQRTVPLMTRNLELVPSEPQSVGLRTGDRVRIEAVADRAGYLTVFNVGPAGQLTQLYPNPLGSGDAEVAANQSVLIADVQVTPPAGCERIFGVWSREPLKVPLAEFARHESGQLPISRAYQATRNLVLVEQAVHRLSGEECQATVVELEHRAG